MEKQVLLSIKQIYGANDSYLVHYLCHNFLKTNAI